MNVLDILTIGSKILDRVIPDPNQKAAAQLEFFKAQQAGEFKEMDNDLQLALAQNETNKIEAASDSFFKSGWRPAAGWVCVSALFYQMVCRPLFGWAATNLWNWSAPPTLELDTLLTLLFGLLGLGAYRMTEKIKGVA
jgi:hypothetical protein